MKKTYTKEDIIKQIRDGLHVTYKPELLDDKWYVINYLYNPVRDRMSDLIIWDVKESIWDMEHPLRASILRGFNKAKRSITECWRL